MMAIRIYVETSVISYLTSRPSRDLLIAARQEATREWWDQRGQAFEPYISRLVLREAANGDVEAATRRLEACRSLPLAVIDQETRELATVLIETHVIPATEIEDALHIALATTTKADFIATWNFAHLVGPVAKFRLQTRIAQLGFNPPLLATPEDLLEELP